jgi:hypothetical protein
MTTQIHHLIDRYGSRINPFGEGEPLAGFDPDGLDQTARESQRARTLYHALGADPDDERYQLGTVATGLWALVEMTADEHAFVVEVEVEDE